MNLESRFATKEEIFSDRFQQINAELFRINKSLQLIDHTEINNQRFFWANAIKEYPVFYASRMWEYPFSILAAELTPGMKCADIGCGTTPFTPYLCQLVGSKNVTGFDPDYFDSKQAEPRYAFGLTKEFVENVGFNFSSDNMTKLTAKDDSFDRVFCISVIEHIKDSAVWQNGIKEMVRILKPGGRLIITVDLGIDSPFVNPLDLIMHSGLIPPHNINLHWPRKRFLKIGDKSLDVFGLVLVKSNTSIFLDYEEKTSIPEFTGFKKYTPPPLSSVAKQLGIDYGRSYGLFRIFLKILSGKYVNKKIP